MAKILLILIFILLAGSLNAQSRKDIFYLWNTNSFYKPVGEKIMVAFSFKTHYEAKQNEVDQNYLESHIRYRLNTHFSVGAGYRLVREKENESWQFENRYLLYLFYNRKIQYINFNFTNRLAFRDFGNSDNHFRYYHKLMLFVPVSLFKKVVHPFVAEELFVKLNNENLHLGRFFVGIRCWNNKKVKLYLYVAKCFQKESPKVWENYPLAGANLLVYL